MNRNSRKLSILLSVIMVLCLFAPYGIVAETTGDGTDLGLPAVLGISTDSDAPSKIMKETTPSAAVYTLVNPAGAGTVTQSGDGKYYLGDSVTITASAINAAGYRFKNWTGDIEATANPLTFNITESNISAGSVNITANFEVNHAPVAYYQPYFVPYNQILNGNVSMYDADSGDSLVPVLVSSTSYGALTLSTTSGSFSYTPDEDFYGKDQFTFRAFDGLAYSQIATADIYVEKTAISITNTVYPIQAYPGDKVEYTITVANAGTESFSDTTVTDSILWGSNTWDVGNLSPVMYGEGKTSDTTTVAFTIPLGTPAGNFTNTAVVTATYGYNMEGVSKQMGSSEGNDYGQGTEITASAIAIVNVLQKGTPPQSQPQPQQEPEQVTLSTNVIGNGTVTPSGGGTTSKGSKYQLTVSPAEGWVFSGWSGANGSEVDALKQIYMDGNKSVTAVFNQIVAAIKQEPAAQAPVAQTPAVIESQVEVTVNEAIPEAPAQLPKTGGVPEVMLYGLGGLISAIGVMIRRKTK